jgi:hypothetical protein
MRDFLENEGFKISKPKLDHLCSPAINEGPPVEYWFCNRPYYDPIKALEWARGRCKQSGPVRPNKQTNVNQDEEDRLTP